MDDAMVTLSVDETRKQPPSPVIRELACSAAKDSRIGSGHLQQLSSRDAFRKGSPASVSANYGLAAMLFFPVYERSESTGDALADVSKRANEIQEAYRLLVDRKTDKEGASRLAAMEMQAKRFAQSLSPCDGKR
jgi:hypothetical protein